MAKHFKPRDYQVKMLDHLIDNERTALFASMGCGKSATCLTYLDMLNTINPIRALIVAPKRVAQSTWVDEVAKWDNFKNLSISAVTGTQKQREKALLADANIHTTNYENIEWLIANSQCNYDVIIADESTRLKSFRTRGGGKRAKALAGIAFNAKNFIELTGTPAPNGLLDLWGQLWFLDQGLRLGRSYSEFCNRYFNKINIGQLAVKYIPNSQSQKQIQDAIMDICLSLDINDYIKELGDTIISNIYVDLPSKARKHYDELEKQMFTELESGDGVEALNAASVTAKCLQIANGALYTDENKNFVEVHDEKLQALESIVNEANGMPVLVSYHFIHDRERILKAFPQARVLDDDPETIREWNRGEIPILLAHPQSAGHGLNLQDGGNILVFFTHTWNLEHYQQIVERIGAARQFQAGHNRPCFIYNIIAKDTVDELVIKRRDSKKTVQEILIEAMKKVGVL